MHVQEALLVEGTSGFSILCYGIFRPSDLDMDCPEAGFFEKPQNSQIHLLFDDQWPNCVLLMETLEENVEDIQNSISNSFSCMFKSGNCLAALCIYDGGFFEYKDIFGSSAADQTYAFCFSEDHHVVNLDAELLSSKEWALIINRCRKRLESYDKRHAE